MSIESTFKQYEKTISDFFNNASKITINKTETFTSKFKSFINLVLTLTKLTPTVMTVVFVGLVLLALALFALIPVVIHLILGTVPIILGLALVYFAFTVLNNKRG